MEHKKDIRIGLVDDHKLIRKAIADTINCFEGYTVVLEADHGKDLQKKIHLLSEEELPEIILMDIDMKEMDGYKTTKWLKGILPETHKTI